MLRIIILYCLIAGAVFLGVNEKSKELNRPADAETAETNREINISKSLLWPYYLGRAFADDKL